MKGKITQWKDDKGFGFIQPDNGTEKLFFHISSVKTNARRPQLGDRVLYEITRDSQQRLRAKDIVIESVKTSSSAYSNPSKKHPARVEPPKKTLLDYFLILVTLVSIFATGSEFYRTNELGTSWPYLIPAIIAYLIISRPKKPKDKYFQCSRCRKTANYDARTIQAWNNGFTKLYCRACHHQWLKDNPKPQQNMARSQTQGCLSMTAFIIILPTLGALGLYQWLI